MTNSFWREKKVLVTGATGLVGSWLIKSLNTFGAQVSALIRDFNPQSELIRSGEYKFIQIIQGELESYSTTERAVSESECDVIIHLGAQAIVQVAKRSPLLTFESNIRGTYNLLEAARTHRNFVKSIVIASSDKAYGTSKVLPYLENMPLVGREPYEVSKSCADLISQSYFHSYQLPVVIARCGNIYGGGDLNFNRLIPGTIKSLLNNEHPIIRSDGTFIRDYIYVKDVVAAYLQLAEIAYEENHLGEAFNFSPEQAVSVIDIVKTLQKLFHNKELSPIIQNDARGEIHSQFLDSSKARQLLNWCPEYSLEEGLAETIIWYKDFLQTTKNQAKVEV